MSRLSRIPTIPRVPSRACGACALLLGALPALAQAPAESAAWELAMLGVAPADVARLAERAGRRAVHLAIVGQNGVSANVLGGLIAGEGRLVYHGCADPNSNTHDTQEARVILQLTNPLGVTVHLHVFQPDAPFDDVAAAFEAASACADVVVTFQSFWGPDAARITDAIRRSPRALVLSPYVEHGGRDTIETPQGHAHKPWQPASIAHFATVVPLSRRAGDGRIVHPSARSERDTEVINFIAPSYHASGPGGTCPSAAVAVAVACYAYAASPSEPTPASVLDLLRTTARVDRAALTSQPPFNDEAVDRLAAQIATLSAPPEGARRLLDATGLLHLGAIAEALAD